MENPADLVYNIPDNTVHISDGNEWLHLPSNPVGGTYTVKPDGSGDFPTIQSAIDYVSSGLKPEANSNIVPPLPVGVKNVIVNIAPGLYHESLFINTSLSDPAGNSPGTDLTNLQFRGLSLIGDPRPIANMTYMNGAVLRSDPSVSTGIGLNSLGQANSIVTLTNGGNTITVTVSVGTPPNFVNCGIIPGDIIIVTDIDGTFQQRNVVSVSGNSVTYDGVTPVTISGNGVALTFCANVQVMSAVPDAIVYSAGGQVEMDEIWFSGNPNFIDEAIYGVVFDNSTLWFGNLLIDGRDLHGTFFGLQSFFGGNLVGALGNGAIVGHVSILACNLFVDTNSHMSEGNIYVMASPAQVEGGSLSSNCVNCYNNGANMEVTNIQVNGAKSVRGLACQTSGFAFTLLFVAFNCINAVLMAQQSFTTFLLTYLIENCTTGFNAVDGNFTFRGTFPFGGITPTITNCGTAINLDQNSNFVTSSSTTITSCPTGIQLTNSSKFVSTNNVIFNSPFTNKYVIDTTSVYSTLHNTRTDPSPNNIFTYTTSGDHPMNSAYLNQRLDSGSSVNVQLDPSLTVHGVPIYQGKSYQLYATGAPQAHTLTLLKGTFVGVGSVLPTSVAKFSG